MFFRGRNPEPTIWRRFRAPADGFEFGDENGILTARVVANAERAVDLFHAITDYLTPAVDVVVEDVRGGKRWGAAAVALPDVRETIARLKIPLSTFAGVEFAVFNEEEQVTLTPHLELYVYARTDRWLYLLQGKGLELREHIRSRSWRLARDEFAAAPELRQALETAADRLALLPA